MGKKTAGVELLVREVLATMSEPYGEDIIEEACLKIEENPDWRKRYDDLCDELGEYKVVNGWIGQYTKALTGLESIREVTARRSGIIKSYTRLSPAK